jgi:hypothetical protein
MSEGNLDHFPCRETVLQKGCNAVPHTASDDKLELLKEGIQNFEEYS